ncbi:MAG TPA: glycosyltransferase family 2 protein [Acidimicrobiia bacterium]|jgi:glycosyltransferase involved in cell wall biosynthesis|nr:glycosyltransferase family 2 protein [Acidimicrobiia bacterium]
MSDSTTKVDVSVVLPVFNESGHLQDEVKRIQHALDNSNYSYEIVIVDDGSTDGSAEVAASLDGVRLIRFGTNRGAGSARKYGTMAALGEVVVWTDVDMTYPNDQIPELVDSLTGYDQVVGARTTEEGTVKFLRGPAKWLIRKLASYLSRTEIPDLNSGFRAFRREVADQFLYLLPRGFSCVTTITMAFLSNGYSIKYVPIEYSPRAGRSKFHWLHDTQRYLLQVVRMVLMHEPIRFFGPPAALIGLIGMGKLIYDLIDKNFRVGSNTIVILGLALALAGVGLIADLLVQLNKRRHDVMPAVVEPTDS